MEQVLLYIKHKLTWYHFRHTHWTHLAWKLDKKLPGSYKTALMSCRCGWHSWWRKKIKIHTFFRALLRCSWRGHDWEGPEPVEVGPVYKKDGEYRSAIDDGDGEVLGYINQCRRCWKCKTSA